MRQFRFRKQADGTTHLNQVHPPASGLSTGKETEETLLVLTPEEMAATDHVEDPLPEPVSDTSVSAGLSNATTESAAAPATPDPAKV